MKGISTRDLAVGDKVGIIRGVGLAHGEGAKVTSVVKVSAKQVTMADGSRWMRGSGRMVGDDGWHNHLVAEGEARIKIAKLRVRNKCVALAMRLDGMKYRLSDIDMATNLLDKIDALVTELEKN